MSPLIKYSTILFHLENFRTTWSRKNEIIISIHIKVISCEIRPFIAPTLKNALSGRHGWYAHAYAICAPFYCISLKKIKGGGYNAANSLISRDLHWRYFRGEFSAPQKCSASGAYQTRGGSEYLIIDKILVFTFAHYAPMRAFFVEGRNILFRISSGSYSSWPYAPYSPRLDIFWVGRRLIRI